MRWGAVRRSRLRVGPSGGRRHGRRRGRPGPPWGARLGLTVEAIVRAGVAPAWPGGVTTDGNEMHVFGRPTPDDLVVAGIVTHDFGPDAVPVRAWFALDRRTVTVEVGEADPETGAPHPMHVPILLAEPDDAALAAVQIIDGRRQRPVRWTVAHESGPDE